MMKGAQWAPFLVSPRILCFILGIWKSRLVQKLAILICGSTTIEPSLSGASLRCEFSLGLDLAIARPFARRLPIYGNLGRRLATLLFLLSHEMSPSSLWTRMSTLTG